MKSKGQSKRKFHKYLFQFEVLSEKALGDVSLEDLHSLTNDGPCSGRFLATKKTVLDGRRAARALIEQGSDAAFFNLTEDGRDTDEQ